MTDPWFEAAFGPHYPLLYQHRDAAEAEQCLDLLPNLAPLGLNEAAVPGPILDLGCGDGRHLASLQKRGYSALGLDLSAALLDRARQRRTASDVLRLIRGDMRFLPFQSSVVSSVLSLFTAFGYFGRLADNRCHVAEVARVLQPGGCWVLDYFDCDQVRRDLQPGRPDHRHRTIGPLSVEEVRQLSNDRDLVCKTVTLTPAHDQAAAAQDWGIPTAGISYQEEVAVWDLAQMDDLAASCGLTRMAAAGTYAGGPLGQGDRWILVYRNTGAMA